MPEQPTYRVGNHQPQNVYRGEQYIGVMFTSEDAALAVEALNGGRAWTDLTADGQGDAVGIVPAREGIGTERVHSTCVDVSASNEPAGTAFVCVSACRLPSLLRDAPPPPPRPAAEDGSGRTCPRHGAVI
jgi:hypothetical protein